MKENSEQKLFDIANNNLFTYELISGIAGDHLLSTEEQIIYNKILKESSSDLYVKLLFHITHQMFSIEKSKQLWTEILNHKKNISKILNRNVEISVATLDYLTNIKHEIKNPKLIGEAFMGKIAEITSIDPLTQVYNRQYLFLKLSEELNRYARYKTSFSVLMIDIDNFKLINDTFGHQKGDEVLVLCGNIFQTSKRELDICGRYGGEEFLFILPHTKKQEAYLIAERIRLSIHTHFKKSVKLTISIGVANCPNHETSIPCLLKFADKALYKSKKRGRNRVT